MVGRGVSGLQAGGFKMRTGKDGRSYIEMCDIDLKAGFSAYRWFWTLFAVLFLAWLLSGCASKMPASVSGGECRIFHDPGFAVQGKRIQDKRWIGGVQETAIEVCGWKRPQK